MGQQGSKRECLYIYEICSLHRNVETILRQAYAHAHLLVSGPVTEFETGFPVLVLHPAPLPVKNCLLLCYYLSKDVTLPKYWNCHIRVLRKTTSAAPKATYTSEDKDALISVPHLLGYKRDQCTLIQNIL
jgi:hypothetical protein